MITTLRHTLLPLAAALLLTACASTRVAPFDISAVAAFCIVPAVSTISSCRMQVRPSTSPMTFITSAAPVSCERRLSTTASPAPRRLA